MILGCLEGVNLTDVKQAGYYFLVQRETDAEPVEVIVGGDVKPLKYGELMVNEAGIAELAEKAFHLHNSDRPVGQVNQIDGLAAARAMLVTGNSGETPATVVLKHTCVVGAAQGFGNMAEEYRQASDVDDVARFGGAIGAPRVTKESATAMVGRTGKKKVDIVVSREYGHGAVEKLLSADNPPLVFELRDPDFDICAIDVQPGIDGLVLQERVHPLQDSDIYHVTGDFAVTERELYALRFGFYVADSRHSNSVVAVEKHENGGIVAVGIGGGQGDRVKAARQAIENAANYYMWRYVKVPAAEIPGQIPIIVYLTSDAFFPDVGALSMATNRQIEGAITRMAAYPTPGMQISLQKSPKTQALLKREEEYWSDGIPAGNFHSEGDWLDHMLAKKMRNIAQRLAIECPLVLNCKGSRGEEQVIEYAAENGITMYMTERDGTGVRCFKHGSQSTFGVRGPGP